MRTLIYARMSNDRTGAGLGIDRQREDCEALADRIGWTIIETFTDNDISAYSGKPRPGYLAMLDALREGRADAVIAWHSDRLHRSPVELEAFIDICVRHSVTVRTVQAGEVDLSTPSGQMTARIIGAVARHEVDHARARMVKAHAQAAELGRAHGRIPYGYRAELDDGGRIIGRVPHPEESKIVREAFDRALGGESLYSIRADWNLRGIVTRAGKPWSAPSLRQMLMRPTYAGLRSHRGNTVPGSWEPIVTEDEHIRIRGLLSSPSRVRHRGTEPKYLLSGIARCGVCKSLLWRLKGKNNAPGSYTCTERRCVSRVIDKVDDLVEELLIRWAEGISSVDELADPESAAAAAEARKLRARIDESVELVASGELSPSSLAKLEAVLLPKIRRLERAAESSPDPHVLELLGPNARAHWGSMDVAGRRAVVRSLVSVTIMPTSRGARFNPDAVVVEWLQ